MAPAALSSDEIRTYRDQGYLVPRFRFASTDVDRLSRRIETLVAAYPNFRTVPLTNAHMPAPGSGLPSLMEFCIRPEILDLVEALDGPDLILWTTTVFHRPAAEAGFTDWHQDGEFWPIHPLAGTSVWVALSECMPQNGCLRVVPGSHKSHAHHVESTGSFFRRVLAEDAFDEDAAVDIILEPGQMMLFDAELIHGSHPNLSGRDRTGFVMRYIPTTSFFDLDGGYPNSAGVPPYADRALFLVRGVDRCGRNDLERNHVQ